MRSIARFAAMAVLSALLSPLPAQEAQPDPVLRELIERVDREAAAVKGDDRLGADQKKALVEAWEAARETLRSASTLAVRAEKYRADGKAADARLTTARAQLAQVGTEPPPSPAGLDLEQVRQRLDTEQAKQNDEQTRLTATEQEIARRTARRRDLPGAIADAERRVEQLRNTVGETPATDLGSEALAAWARARAEQLLAERQVASLRAENAWYDASDDMLRTERDLAARRVAELTSRVKVWQDAVAMQRRDKAAAAKKAADADVEQARRISQQLGAFAEQNVELAHRESVVAALLEQATEQQKATTDKLKDLRDELRDTRDRVDAAGLTEAIGLLLRQRRSSLPSQAELARSIARRQPEIADVQIERLDREIQRNRLRDKPGSIDLSAVAADRLAVAASLARQLETRRLELLERLIDDLQSYFNTLVVMDTQERLLLSSAREYAGYVNERILWVRSAEPLWRPQRGLREGAYSLLDLHNWRETFAALLTGVGDRPVLAGLGLLFAFLLLLLARRFAAQLEECGKSAVRGTCTTFKPTAQALLATAGRALPMPLLGLVIGFLLADDPLQAPFPRAVGAAIAHASWLALAILLLRSVARSGGLGVAHFRWSASAQQALRRHLRWLLPLLLPLSFVVTLFEELDAEAPSNAIWGRLALIAALLALALFFLQILHARRGALPVPANRRLRRLLMLLGVGAPLALVLLAVLGYHFTALQLVRRLEATMALVFGLIVIRALLLRAMLLTRRRLALQHARERKKAATTTASAQPGSEIAAVEEPALDLAEVDAQLRRLVTGGIALLVALLGWLIWVDVLPALALLREVVLWKDLSGAQPVTFTLANLLFSLFLLAVTYLAVRNVPGVVDAVFLQRSSMHAGERSALTTVVRYTLVLIGVIVSFNAIGIGWSKVQWLAAAVSVGLGFGLQEIFANFVSGLILLFERPVRVGDLVTVNGIEGKISRIRIRATTITDWDRRELVVPNKDLITNSVINWTLSDPITRLVFPVGIAYGSDTAKARELLLKVAREDPLVLDEPAPNAVFRSFGSSSLDFELRVFLRSRDDWARLTDSINDGIDQAFRKAGIEIAFPQRDLHVRSIGPLVEVFGREGRDVRLPGAV